MRFVDLRNSADHLVLLQIFYDNLFVPGFPDPDERESLATLQQNLVNVEAGFYGQNTYHIVLGLDDRDRPVAACIADYLCQSNCGAIEYILVDASQRGTGLGRAIHDHTATILARDAQAAGQGGIDAVMIEINDPYSAPPELDNVDPFERLMMWHKWGYQRLRFPYLQPALSEDQAAIDYLLMAVRIINPAFAEGFPSAKAHQLVVDYLVWANRFDAFDTDPFYQAMTRFAETVSRVPLQRLDRYIGRDPAFTLDCRQIADPLSAEFDAVIGVYRRAFPDGATAVHPDRFEQRLTTARPADTTYHLCGFAAAPAEPIAGMASFFVMPGLGFLGYLVLEPPLRGHGLARVALQQIEERMFRDRSDVVRHYVECDVGSPQEAVFKALGFVDSGIAYAQPVLTGRTGAPVPMSLLVKALGDPPIPLIPAAEEIAKDIVMINTTVYSGVSQI